MKASVRTGATAGAIGILPTFLLSVGLIAGVRPLMELLVWTIAAPWFFVPAAVVLVVVGAGIGVVAGLLSGAVALWEARASTPVMLRRATTRLAWALAVVGDAAFAVLWLAGR